MLFVMCEAMSHDQCDCTTLRPRVISRVVQPLCTNIAQYTCTLRHQSWWLAPSGYSMLPNELHFNPRSFKCDTFKSEPTESSPSRAPAHYSSSASSSLTGGGGSWVLSAGRGCSGCITAHTGADSAARELFALTVRFSPHPT
jgi:hypothetical protein